MSAAYDIALQAIYDSNLTPKSQLAALGLLGASPDGVVTCTKERAGQLTNTTSWGATRRILGKIQAAGLIHYRTNELVYIAFSAYFAGDGDDQSDQLRAKSDQLRALFDQPRAKSDHDDGGDDADNPIPVIEKRASEITFRSATREKRASARAFDPSTYTHASARAVVVVDPILSNQEIGETTTTSDETERALSVALLMHVGLKPMSVAKRLAAEHPFERIRDCVAHWWPRRKCAGGQFEDAPLIVTYWLDHWAEAMIPPMPAAFRHTELYRSHCRSPAERKAELEAENLLDAHDQPAETGAPVNSPDVDAVREASAVDVPSDIQEAWANVLAELEVQMPAQTFEWLRGAWVLSYADGELVIGLARPDGKQWLEVQLTRQIERRLASMLRRRLNVRFATVDAKAVAS